MEELKALFEEIIHINLIQAVLSSPRGSQETVKVKVRPMELKDGLRFQFESFTKTQAFHENLTAEAAVGRLCEEMRSFKQLQAKTTDAEYSVLVSKKGKATIRRKKLQDDTSQVRERALSHNREKRYILEEGRAVPFLVDLGVMTTEGRIVRAQFDKFRQINRFLEFIEDILPRLEKGRELTILDFGCGKSYLTFAMYYYLHELKEYDIRIIGLDLKKDVIAHCSALAEKYGYQKLTFLTGDIADYEGVSEVDMVVTLHACDTATDYALAKAVGWNASVILSVPCCQHELNRQIKNENISPITKYGLLKERFAALLTDGLRAEYLESQGYDTQVLEFIDMEHTPKNILIRAVKSKKINTVRVKKSKEEIRVCEEFFAVKPTLGELLKK